VHWVLLFGVMANLLSNIVQWLRFPRMTAWDRYRVRPLLIASSVLGVVLFVLVIFF
jgi:hypothetical protein